MLFVTLVRLLMAADPSAVYRFHSQCLLCCQLWNLIEHRSYMFDANRAKSSQIKPNIEAAMYEFEWICKCPAGRLLLGSQAPHYH